MHEHVQADFFLFSYCQRYFFAHRFEILQVSEFAFFESSARLPYLRRLRKGTDGRGGQQGKLKTLPLHALDAPANGLARSLFFLRQALQTFLHHGIMDPCGLGPRATCLGRSGQDVGYRVLSMVQASSEGRYLMQLLDREREPAPDFLIQPCFQLEINRAMLKRTTRRNPQSLAQDSLHA